MHICFICHEYPPAQHGGIGSFTQTLARELVRHGHHVSSVGLYPIGKKTVDQDQGVHVVRLPQGTFPRLRVAANYLRMQRALRELHRAHPIDIVEGAERAFCLVSPRLPIAKVIRMHGGHVYFRITLGQQPEKQKAIEERRSFQVATHICAVSRFVGETTRRRLNLGDRPIPVILNPVDLRVFYPRDPALEEEGLIVYVGTIVEKKGIRQLLEAMPQVLDAFSCARLIAYGNDTLDPVTGQSFTALLRGRIPSRYADRITLAGPVPRERLPELLAKASICIYPSHMEALPIAWVEGLAMGKAVIGSQTGPGPEVIEDEVSGILCNPHDPGSIAAALLRLLPDPALRARLGAAARGRAERLFSLAGLVPQNVAYYEACAREFRNSPNPSRRRV